MSAGSFSPRDEMTIREEDVVGKQMDETKKHRNEEGGCEKKSHNNNKRSLVWFPCLKPKRGQSRADAESNNAPRWPQRETHRVDVVVLCLICRGKKGKRWAFSSKHLIHP